MRGVKMLSITALAGLKPMLPIIGNCSSYGIVRNRNSAKVIKNIEVADGNPKIKQCRFFTKMKTTPK